MSPIKTLFSLFILIAWSQAAQAQISVNRSVIEFTAEQPIQDIEIRNNGDFRIYLDLKVSEIINPEREDSKRVELTDPRSAAVLVSPKQVMLPPGTRKRVRIILRDKKNTIDRVFRLAVKPYTGKVKLDPVEGDKKQSAIKVLIGYDLLLLARPSKLNPDIKVSRTNNSIEFVNQGNTNVLLRDIQQCDATKTDCVELQSNRLYAGEVYKVDLPRKGDASQYPVKVLQSVGLSNSLELY
ncbi:MAG: fimbria/pilus periplasmic chaperone [Granulosicoccus sp.]|nr:fimbria/pilus periplasmic chaperone [Granulosicoccus sp.]